MRVTRNSWWINLSQSIVGYDEGGEGADSIGEEGTGSTDSVDANGASGEAEDGQGSSGISGEGDGASEDTSGLKSALQKEREGRRAMEKELKALRRAEETRANANKSEVERATEAEARAAAKVEKLASGFRKTALHSAVLKAAGAAKFRDPSDALRPEILEAIGVEQDEDDPTQITIDEASVTSAIKNLAKAKPHYLAVGDSSQQKQKQIPKSGSTFNGSATQSNLTSDEQSLAKKYPALAHRIH